MSRNDKQARAATLEALEPRVLLSGSVLISEFMAKNTYTLADEDGDYSDWIELFNSGPTSVNLNGYYLTDKTTDLKEWKLPSVTLPSGEYLVIFASGKDRKVAGQELHTNFQLGASGGYLALVEPDGTTIDSQYSPTFPAQYPDISYGLANLQDVMTLVQAPDTSRWHVPTSAVDDATWKNSNFNDSAWTAGQVAIGYDTDTTDANYLPLIRTNVQGAMMGANSSIYVRIAFNVADPTVLRSLSLAMQSDDGFVAYINGTKVASFNAPVSPAYDSAATDENLPEDAVTGQIINISSYLGLLHAGTNELAIQGLNLTVSDSDFLMSPTLSAQLAPSGTLQEQYFQYPTPGEKNSPGVNELGPIVTAVTHSPQVPSDTEPLTVTAHVSRAAAAVSSVVLHYLVNWGAESTQAMYDDGAHGDGAAGDGVYGAVIPASAAAPSEMIRYYITATDSASHPSRMPLFLDSLKSAQYYGTVVSDPSIQTNIPVFQYFIDPQDLPNADTLWGTQGDVFYLGELYDNVFIRSRGSTVNGSHTTDISRKVEFNTDHHFLYTPGVKRVNEINMNLPGPQDSSYLRQTLSYWMYDAVGVAGPASFDMHVQQNGSFSGVRVFWQQADQDELQQEGLDPDGGLYRAGGSNLSGTGGFEYKTLNATQPALQTLVNGLKITNANRHTYVMDNLDLAALVNYLAIDVIIEDTDSAQTNYYVYQDPSTSEWQMIPYDRDLTWGCYVGGGSSYIYDDNGDGLNTVARGAMAPNDMVNPMYLDYNYYYKSRGWNRLADAIKRDPTVSQMFFRRVRTLMDEWLKPPGTPAGQLPIETQIDALMASLSHEQANDQLQPQEAGYGTFTDGVQSIKDYLANRRTYMYTATIGGFTLDAAQPAAFAGQILIGNVDAAPVSGNQDEEYIQLTNPNNYAVDISGWKLTSGVNYTFPAGTVITANGSLYVSPDPAAFRARTTGPRGGQGLFVEGPYRGNLDSHGETIRLETDANLPINEKTYNSATPVINEVMTNGAGGDWVEVYNPTAADVNLSGWHLSDSGKKLTKYTILNGTVLPAGGYLVFTEAQFGSAFGFSKNGESVYLSNAASTVIDSEDFGGSDPDTTFGLYRTQEGKFVFTAMVSPTAGAANSAPLVGPVVMDQIMYHPLDDADEFITLRNITDSPVKLYDPAAPSHTWTISGGVDYTFPTGVEIPAEGLVVLTGADVSTPAMKDAFKAANDLPADAQVFGPWDGKLDNAGEDVNLNKVGPADPDDGSYPVIRVDRVDYSPDSPWPTAADVDGKSLKRVRPNAFGNDAFSWVTYPATLVDSLDYEPGPYGTGDSIVVNPSIVNYGGMSAPVTGTLEFRLSADATWGNADDIVFADDNFMVPILDDGETYSPGPAVLSLSFGIIDTQDYYLVARSTIGSDVPQTWWPAGPDIHLYNTANYTRLKAGGSSSFPDATGDKVTISFSGPGFVDFSTDNGLTGPSAAGDFQQIVMGNTTAASSLRVTTAGKGDTNVQALYVRGMAKSITAPKLNVVGTMGAAGIVAINDTISSLSLGDMNPAVVADVSGPNPILSIGGSQSDVATSISLGDVLNLDLTSGMPIKSLTVADWEDSASGMGTIQAPRIDKLTSSGDFLANLQILGATTPKTLSLGTTKIAGDMGGNWNIIGDMGNLTVGGTANAAAVRGSGNMGAISLGASTGSDFLAGINAGLRHAVDGGSYAAQATIKSFRVRGGKGFLKTDLLFQDSNVSAYKLGPVSLLNVNRSNSGARFGVYGHTLGTVKVLPTSKTPVPPGDFDILAV